MYTIPFLHNVWNQSFDNAMSITSPKKSAMVTVSGTMPWAVGLEAPEVAGDAG
jgi:hypothetical protein